MHMSSSRIWSCHSENSLIQNKIICRHRAGLEKQIHLKKENRGLGMSTTDDLINTNLSESLRENCDISPQTPSVKELECILYSGKSYMNHVDEVWPNLFLGDMCMAHDRHGLWKLGITHVLNAAHGKPYCQGSHAFYGTTMDYYGVPANDLPTFDISPYFHPTAGYIHEVLNTPGARIFVHCAVGVSRSASLVLAYLMIYHHFTLVDAIRKVKENRWIFPNRGFLKQLRNLDITLHKQRKMK